MSYITDIILVTVTNDGGNITKWTRSVDKLNRYLLNIYGKKLEPVQMYAGGGKPMLCDVFIGGYDQFDIPKFCDKFLEINWEQPDHTQLMIKDEHECRFKTYYASGLTSSEQEFVHFR